MSYLVWIWHNADGIRLNSLLRILVGMARVAAGLLMVWLCKLFIDVTIRTGSSSDIVWMVCLLVATVLGGILLRQLYYFMSVSAKTRQTNTIRLRLFSQLFTRQLYDEQMLHSGDVTSRMAKDIDMVSDATTDSIPQLVVTAIQLSGAFLLLRYLDETLAWVILLLTPFALAFGKLVSRSLRKMTLAIREDESRIQMQIQEGMEQNAVLRALSSEMWVTGRLDSMQQQLKGNVMRRARFTVLMRFMFGAAFGLGYLVAFIWGGLQLRASVITFGVMTSFLQLVGQIQQPILSLLNTAIQLFHASASIDRLKELEQAPDSNASAATPAESAIAIGAPTGIRLSDVNFHYASGDRLILDHFSHDFKAGTKTALMGPTGIGKTTLFRLLLALVKPDSGTISLYINKVEEPVSESTRPHFVFVPQGNTLMSGTIRYNLQLAKPEATEAELRDVLRTAAADFVFDLPDGIDTELGERGSGLSEGQAQRIAIARGLLRPGSILLLDEISASLDEQTEHQLYERLFRRYPEKTMIFITHRPTVSKLCDEVVKFL